MSAIPITVDSKILRLRKPILSPDFESKTVLVGDTWDYVHLWLDREGMQDALFYWDQARSFYNATLSLDKTSAPLTAYYSFLNATKALLTVKARTFSESHGVIGESTGTKTSLSSEIVTFKPGGILAALCNYLGETSNNEDYSLKDLLYNLPYIHRAFHLSFVGHADLFFPVTEPIYVRRKRSSEAWFQFEVTDRQHKDKHFLNILPDGFEKDKGIADRFVVRLRRRFRWEWGAYDRQVNLNRLTNYHRRVRKHLHYIHGPRCLWYVKRAAGRSGYIDRNPLTLAFAAMHRLSELSRYEPFLLQRHFGSQHNWLLSEFLSTSPDQFIDQISSEITSQDFMIPGRRLDRF